MSRIDDLIQELCPDGVDYRELQEIFELRNGYTPSKSDASNWDGGGVPWFRMEDIRAHGRVLTASQQEVTFKAVKGGRLFPADSIIVATSATLGEHALIHVPHLSNQRFTNLALREEFRGLLDVNFLNYYCDLLDQWCTRHANVSSFASVDMKLFRRFKFPIPPLEIQQEIVRILDQFTQLEAELEAELEARKKQYAYYRERLLTFTQNDFDGRAHMPSGLLDSSEQGSLSQPQVRWVTLGEVVEVRSGWGFPKRYQGASIGELPFYKVSDMNNAGNEHYLMAAANYVSLEDARTLGVKAAPAGTVVFPKIGAAVRTNKKRLLHSDAAYDNNVMGLVPGEDVDPGFLFFWMLGLDLSSLASDSGAVPSIRKSEMEGVRFPLLPIGRQRQISETLDQFDALVNDLNSGLPAEIEVRRKQYEYYRDKLLTFPEKEA